METKIVYEDKMREQLQKLAPRLEKLRDKEIKKHRQLVLAKRRYEDAKKEAHRISEKMAGLRGLIENCKDGKLEVGYGDW